VLSTQGLRTLEPLQRLLTGGAEELQIGDLPVPPLQMSPHPAPGVKAVPGDAAALHLAGAALIVSLVCD
jgi:hypothetical protein